MTTTARNAKCRTCGESFKRTFARQRKCGACRYANVYNCAVCGKTYERCDDVKVCDCCLEELKPPTGSVDVQAWDNHLALIGNGTSRGACVGESKIAYESELPTPSSGDEAGEGASGGLLESIADRRATPEAELIGDELLQWFLSASAYEVGKKFGLPRTSVQRLRSEYMGVDRAEVEIARQVLGFRESEWQARKLGIALVRARADAWRESLKAA
jgi:hypothetical protein